MLNTQTFTSLTTTAEEGEKYIFKILSNQGGRSEIYREKIGVLKGRFLLLFIIEKIK